MRKNGYAALSKHRAIKRRKLDDYETPENVTRALTRAIRLRGPIWEPAAGSGRMVRALRDQTGHHVRSGDIKRGADFLAQSRRWEGCIITNPPYRNDLAERFVQHALKLADGRVCMLMQSGFLWSSGRYSLFKDCPPDRIIVLCDRIYFSVNGKPIDSQFFSHAWICWPRRSRRAKDTITRIEWRRVDSVPSV